MSKFTHLHVHSHYSLLDGLPKIDEILDYAQKFGMDSVALTDHGVIYGAVEFYKKATERKIKPIIGTELYLALERMVDKKPNIDDKRYHIILLVKNEIGYKNLVKLLTKAHLEGFYYKPRIDEELLKQYSEGLICLSACLQGKIPKLILAKRIEEAEKTAQKYQEIFGTDNFYLELQHHPNIREQKIVNEALITISKKFGIPLVATNDCHYLKPEDAQAQDILMLINTGADPNDPERLTLKADDFSMRSPEKMAEDFKEIPEAIENTQKIVNLCNFQFTLGKTKLPQFEVPSGKTQDEYLRELCYRGLKRRFGENVSSEIIKRLEYELSVIKQTGFASYFLIVQDFVNWAKENRIVVGPGRGCLLLGTKILMADGTQKEIQKIEIGDSIISGEEKIRKVTNIFNYDINEKVAAIEAKMPPGKKLFLTADHKLLATRHQMCPVMKGDKKTICKPTCNRSCKNQLWKDYKLEWIEAKNLRKNDFLVYPITSSYHCREVIFDLFKFDKHLKGDKEFVWYEIGTNKLIPKKVKRYIKLDKKLARLLGFYLAEGFVRLEKKFKGKDISHGIIGFGFNKNEIKNIEEVRKLLWEIFGLNSSLAPHKKRGGIEVLAYSRVVAKFFKKLCGKGALNKSIPPQIIKSPNKIIISLLTALFKGDGSNKGVMRISFDSVSYNLISQVKLLLARLGIMASVKSRKYKEKNWNPSYKLTISGKQLFKYNQIFKDFRIPIKKQKFYRNDYFIQGNYIFFPVKNLEIKGYHGKVYDFTVEKDVSYVANDITVHNSVGGSLVSYLLNITNIDPLKYNLLFERFLNPERVSMPDIDLDFTDRRRDEVIEYVRQKYGQDKVAQIITFGTMAARAVIRDVGRALGYPYLFCDKIAKMIPFGQTLDETLAKIPEFRQLYEMDSTAQKLIEFARKLEGVARHASTHACGVVISAEPLDSICPLQHPTQDDEAIVTQYEMHSIEDLGLLKMDFLGLKNLTIIEDALARIYKVQDKKIDIENIPLDDKETFKLFQRGETIGVFQLECLPGDTIVSNTTLKKLYKRKNKKTLRSIYLNGGEVRSNRILSILESGEKELYTLIAENNWYIKASKDHYFLTENGWEKLENIKVGDKILIKTKAKHLVYNTCQICGKQIDGQKEGKSKFCYKCSASFYRNPSKKVSREKIKEGRLRFYQQGGKPWNYGVTTENNEIWRKTAEKISKALSGRTFEEVYGIEKAKELKKKISQRSKGENNPMFGKPSPHRKGGFREDLGHYVRSTWEADFARILKLHNLDYKYEPRTFRVIKQNGEIVHYTPDFYVKSTSNFYEIKGWLHELDQEKIELFQQQYPQYNLVLISATKFAEFALKYKTLINWECPRIPTKQSFNFIKVKEIKYSGKEKTYDIVMQSPGNNFVANGFLVHNSDGMRRYLKQLKPTEFEDIIAMVALYRPGPIQFIPDYIAGKHKKKKITPLHPKLKPILEKTFGVCIYQEQLMQIARDLAGFSLSEADVLRKAIGKKIKSLLLEQKEKLVEGMRKNGIEKEIAHKIWEWILPFARYGFNRSHATAYAQIAYQTAYLKAHFTVEFMSSLLTSEQADVERIGFLIEECKRMGIEVLPPDINESWRNFTAIPGKKQIRFGLLAIKNVGGNFVEALVKERELRGSFQSIEDFLLRINSKDLNKKSLESLIKAGVFDKFAERNLLFFNLEKLLEFNRENQRTKFIGQKGLFDKFSLKSKIQLQKTRPATKSEKLAWEKELLGLFVSSHPLEDFKHIFEKKIIKISELNSNSNKNNHRVKIGGIISRIKKIITRNGKPMLFMNLEDLSDKIEIVVFPSMIERNPTAFQENKIVLVSGRVDNRDGIPKLICEDIEEILEET